MKELTKAEEEVMRYLWAREKAFVKELLEDYPEPKPAYNTVSTIVRILEQKGFIGHTAYGKTHQYHPLITQDAYSAFRMKDVMQHYFGNSFQRMFSFFAKKENISTQDLDDMLKDLQKNQEE